MGLYPLWHKIKDQRACIPYGIGLKTNGLVFPIIRLKTNGLVSSMT
jgi:hypothetical protein